MIVSRAGLFGVLYQFQRGTEDELAEAWFYIRERYGDKLTGEIYGHDPLPNIIINPTILKGNWLFALRDS